MPARPSRFEGILIDPNELVFDQPLHSGADFGHLKHQFFRNTQQDLDRISQTTLGSELLELIAKRHRGIGTSKSGADRTVTILFRPPTYPGASTGAMRIGDRFAVARTVGRRQMRFAGRGSACKIRMHNGPGSEEIYSNLCGIRTPVWVALAHELIHAFHQLSGTTYSDEVQVPNGHNVRREEMWTTGLGVYASTRLSENAIRAAAGLPQRPYYNFPNDHTHIQSLTQAGAVRRPGYWYCACLQHEIGDL